MLASDVDSHSWSVTNIGHYLHLSPYTIYKFDKIGDQQFLPYGHGTGMKGMPGDLKP